MPTMKQGIASNTGLLYLPGFHTYAPHRPTLSENVLGKAHLYDLFNSFPNSLSEGLAQCEVVFIATRIQSHVLCSGGFSGARVVLSLILLSDRHRYKWKKETYSYQTRIG